MGSLLESQTEAGIVRVRSPIRFPDTTSCSRSESYYSSSGRSRPRHNEEEEEEEEALLDCNDASSNIFEELQYSSSSSSQPDIFVENGGFMSIITSQKLPALHNVGFSVGRVSLEEVGI